MTQLAIANCRPGAENNWMPLLGSALMPGQLEGQYLFNSGVAENVHEEILVPMRGSRLQMRAILQRLEQLNPDRHALADRGQLTLRLWSEEQEAWYYSPISELILEGLPGQLEAWSKGTACLRLKFTRPAYFDSEEMPLALSNRFASGQSTGLRLLNHSDRDFGHDNCFEVDSLLTASLSRKAPLRLALANTYSGPALGDFFLGCLHLPEGGAMPNFSFEMENAVGGEIKNDVNASNGKYCQYSWSGSNWQNLAVWELPFIELAKMAGHSFLPILRFFSTQSDEGLRLRLLLSVNGSVVQEFASHISPVGQKSLPLSPLTLPVGRLPLRQMPFNHSLHLQALSSVPGTHILQLDDLLLLPQDGTIIAEKLVGLPLNGQFLSDAHEHKNWSQLNGQELCTHYCPQSDGLFLLPSSGQRFCCFQTGIDGSANIARSLSVRAWYRQRRSLP